MAESKRRILEYFFEHPTERLRVRQIERQAKISLPSAIRYARELAEEGLLKRSVIAGVTLYSADRSSTSFLLEKRLHNLRRLHTSGLIEYILQKCSNPPIIVFGSYSRGEDIETSDIDLYVQTPLRKLFGLEAFEGKLNRKIQLFLCRSPAELRNKHLFTNVMNGITLNGTVEIQ